ncbi:MarR family transcriptional regulator, negative regulator of the multidrug operon emrRAB [Bathymodiolus japonicus methanotrophic gill symbiont]|uniref:MarR family winged helix-turn-helix transcriptional regulator n=1 Tax=Bathymodiolus japonicus methanotrophic gill symbiont TaxID=113269 RepID=UPI001B56171B|nr:MarR family winged helix-turn-helix transcriptional regulator [Bathymodiolus japonicus methanotrophic gill symbiont]GFO72200.1 MarR family transcriptional regulator, negative regulator of the multidrug operon emrRAB [Bathymodiolus japonicus methanotrophic gill symbiont]
MPELTTLKLIERISTLLRAEQRKKYSALGLQPVHVQTLDYLASCNRFSDTPAAVTDYLGLTKGTVSQTLQVLVRKGYLEKQQDTVDKRIVHLKILTPGQELLKSITPFDVFTKAEQAIANKQFDSISAALYEALVALQNVNGTSNFGQCKNCITFSEQDDHYYCLLMQQPLQQDDIEKICREYISVTNSGLV